MDTLPLPPRPNLEQYKKRAKDLVTAAKSEDASAVRAWATDWLQTLVRLLNVELTPFVQDSFDRAVGHIEQRVLEKLKSTRDAKAPFSLADAQFLIARAHGFETWPEFTSHVESASQPNGPVGEFEQAADAVVHGDLAALESLLREHPELIRERSKRVHRATLLHYVAANGVEDFRQKTPANAVAVARLLLDAGAEVDALANTYGGGSAQTTMNLLVSSAHPAGAGLQGALVEVLADYGVSIDGVENDSSPLMTALAFGYQDAADALARRGASIDNVVTAAALGRLDLVKTFVDAAPRMKPSLIGLYWLTMPKDWTGQLERALVWACKFGRGEVAAFLLDAGVNPASKDNDSMTALHWAAACPSLEIVRMLLARGAPLEVRNTWGGTVLDSTGYFARQEPRNSLNYVPVMEALLAAGADPKEVSPFPTGNTATDELLRRYGVNSGKSL